MIKYILAVTGIIAIIVTGIILFEFNDKQYTVKITEKERIVSNTTESKYLVWGEDENGKEYVFENTDTLMRGKFDSSTLYGRLKKNKTYKLTVIGYRIPFFSSYENIIKVEEE